MEKKDAVEAVISVLKTVQELSGRESVPITGTTCPIGDLDQFDSLNGVEASSMLSSELGFDLPGANAFVNEEGTKALNVTEIADAICKFAEAASS